MAVHRGGPAGPFLPPHAPNCRAGRGLPELRRYLLDQATPGEWTLEAGQATDRGEDEQVRCACAAPAHPRCQGPAVACGPPAWRHARPRLTRCRAAVLWRLPGALDRSASPACGCACRACCCTRSAMLCVQALEVVREKLFRRLYAELPYTVRLRLTSCMPLADGSGEQGSGGSQRRLGLREGVLAGQGAALRATAAVCRPLWLGEALLLCSWIQLMPARGWPLPAWRTSALHDSWRPTLPAAAALPRRSVDRDRRAGAAAEQPAGGGGQRWLPDTGHQHRGAAGAGGDVGPARAPLPASQSGEVSGAGHAPFCCRRATACQANDANELLPRK